MDSKNTYSVTFFTAMTPGLGCCEKATLSEGGMLPKSNMDVAEKQHWMLPKSNMDVAEKQHWMLPKSNTVSMAEVGIPVVQSVECRMQSEKRTH